MSALPIGPIRPIGPMSLIGPIGLMSPIRPIGPMSPIRPMSPMRPMRPMRLMSLMSLTLLLALLPSCSTDDPESSLPTPDLETPISFSGSMPDDQSVTRASGLEDSQTTFTVYGYKNDAYDSSTGSYTSYQTVFPGFTVNYGANTAYTSTSNTSDWEYVGITAEQTIKYWDWGANAYRFFAYALGSGSSPATVTAGSASGSDPVVATLSATVNASSDATIANAPYFSHLWFSTGNSTTYPDKQFGQPVTLEFLKPFARVRFIFTFAEGVNINRSQLNGIEFKPYDNTSNKIATAGTVTVTYPLTGTATAETWATSETTSTIDKFTIDYYEADDTYTPDDTNTATVYDNTPLKWYTVLPQSLGAFAVYVQVVTTDVKTAIVPAEYMDWKAGYEYTYKFKIIEGGGVTLDIIQVAINQWGTDHAISHPVYNW